LLRSALVLLAVALAPLASAQPATPSGREVVEAWADGWRRAMAGVDRIEAEERAEHTFDGPRRRTTIQIEGRATLGPGRPGRRPRHTRIDGRALDPEDAPRAVGRWVQAFGPAGREVGAPPPLPAALLMNARVGDLRAETYDGQAAWRVDLSAREDRIRAWFTRSASDPRLLAVRVEGERPRGGRIVREVRYARVRGLDLPTESRTTFTVRQRRRLRAYVVTLSASGSYSDFSLR